MIKVICHICGVAKNVSNEGNLPKGWRRALGKTYCSDYVKEVETAKANGTLVRRGPPAGRDPVAR